MSEYEKLIKSHYFLKTLPELEACYRPYYDLGLRLKETVLRFVQLNESLIQQQKFQFSFKIDDYIFLKRTQIVDVKKMGFLRNVVSRLSGDTFLFSDNTIRDFWIRARVYSLKLEEPNIRNHTNLNFLNILSTVCGYRSFKDFLLVNYRDFASGLKILVLPLLGDQGQAPSAEILLNKRLDLLAEMDKLKVTVEFKYTGSKSEKQRYFTPKSARKEGESEGADLVIFGDILNQLPGKPKIALQYVIVDPNHGLGTFPENAVAEIFEYSDLITGLIPNELDAIVYWCLGIKEFLNEKYEEAIHFFLKIQTDTELEKEDIYFRIGVIYDWMEKNNLAIHYYALALEAGGIISTWRQLSMWTRSGDLIEQDKLCDPEKFKSKEIKMLLFEIVRIQHALLLKKNGSHLQARKYLEQAMKYIRQSWLDSAYRDLIAEAYYSLALLCRKSLKNGRVKNPENVISLYFSAIKLGKAVHIHQDAADFFLGYTYLDKAIDIIKEHHGHESGLLVYYKEKLEEKRAVPNPI